jgi:hypothetical protein
MIADTLRRAADLLDKYALDANDSGTPWRADFCTVHGGDGEIIAETQDGRAAALWEAEWIALMHPGVATPLAAWLRAEADSADACQAYIESINATGDPDMAAATEKRHQHPLTLAHSLLGET